MPVLSLPPARRAAATPATQPSALAEAQRVRTALMAQRGAVERAWGPIDSMSDQVQPGRLVLRTARGYLLVLGMANGELWVDAHGG